MTATTAPTRPPSGRLPDERPDNQATETSHVALEFVGARDGEPRRVAVLRALQLGDLLCAVPALRALRARYPGALVTLISLPWARAFAARYRAYIDDFVEFPGWPGLPERTPDLARIADFLAECHERRFDLAIQLHGSGSHVNELVALLGAQRCAGFFLPGDHVPDDELFVPWPREGSEARRLLRVAEHLGATAPRPDPEFPLTPDDEADLARVPAASALRGERYVCLHPGARFPSRRWPAERFAAVADALVARGLRVAITGTADEAAVTSAVRAAMREPATDLTGSLSLGALGALLSRAALVVSNDTGVSHVTAGVGTPSVVIASGSDAIRWAPGDARRHRVLWHDVPCRPCGHLVCPVGHPCASAVTVHAVLGEALQLLSLRLHAR